MSVCEWMVILSNVATVVFSMAFYMHGKRVVKVKVYNECTEHYARSLREQRGEFEAERQRLQETYLNFITGLKDRIDELEVQQVLQ